MRSDLSSSQKEYRASRRIIDRSSATSAADFVVDMAGNEKTTKPKRNTAGMSHIQQYVTIVSVICLIVVFVSVYVIFYRPRHDSLQYPFEGYVHKTNRDFKTELFWKKMNDRDIYGHNSLTVITQLRPNRVDRLLRLSNSYGGPIIGVVLIGPGEEQAEEDKRILNQFFMQEKDRCSSIDIHLVYDDGGFYPANVLRNIGVENCFTDRLIVADVDLVFSEDTVRLDPKLPPPGHVMVIPCFDANKSMTEVPTTKSELILSLKRSDIQPIYQDTYAVAHAPTDFDRWIDADKDYSVEYVYPFEPFYIGRKDDIVAYDERFRGYGEDKAQQAYHMSLTGVNYMVHHSMFVIHMYHKRDTSGWKMDQTRLDPMLSFMWDMKQEFPDRKIPDRFVLPAAIVKDLD